MFSVVIATHNRRKRLLCAVESLACQTLPPIEVVVVDDGSEPAVSRRELARILGVIPLVFHRNSEPSGPSAARNRGLALAKGEWVCFLDDDDMFMPDKLAVLEREVRCKLGVDLIFHPALMHLEREGIMYVSSRSGALPGAIGYQEMLVSNRIGGTPMVAVRRACLVSIGGFDESLPALEDYELWLRLAASGARIYGIGVPLTKYSVLTSEASVSRSDESNRNALDAIRRKYEILDGDTLMPSERLAHLAWGISMEVNRAILAGDKRKSIMLQLRKLRCRITFLDFAVFALLLVGPSAVLMMRARIFRPKPPAI